MGFNSVSSGLDRYAEKLRQLFKSEQENVQKGNEQLKKITDSHNKTNTNKVGPDGKPESGNAQKVDGNAVQNKQDQSASQEARKQPEQASVDQQRSDFVATKQEANAFARNILKDTPKMAQSGDLAKAPEMPKQKNALIDNIIKQEVPRELPNDAKPKLAEKTKVFEKVDPKQTVLSDKLDKKEQIKDQKDLNSNAVLKDSTRPEVVVKPGPEAGVIADKKENDKPEFKSEKKKASENTMLTSRTASKSLRQLNQGFGFDTNTNLNGGDEEGFYLDATAITIESIDELPSGTLSGLVGATYDEGEVVGSSGFLDKAMFFHSQVLRERTIRTTIASVSEMQDQFDMPVEKRIPSEHLSQIRLGRTTGVYGGLIG